MALQLNTELPTGLTANYIKIVSCAIIDAEKHDTIDGEVVATPIKKLRVNALLFASKEARDANKVPVKSLNFDIDMDADLVASLYSAVKASGQVDGAIDV